MTKSNRVSYQMFNARGLSVADGFAMRDADESKIDAVARSIARRTGLKVCGLLDQGSAIRNGKPSARHYELTLGEALPQHVGGGYSVRGSVCVSIEVQS